MFDVEFLLQPASAPKTVLYRYRSGILRSRMHAALKSAAEHKGKSYLRVPSQDLSTTLAGGSLFADESVLVCDLGHKVGKPDVTIGELLDALDLGRRGLVGLFIDYRNPLLTEPSWKAIEAKCQVVDEPQVTRTTMKPILSYLEQTTDLAERPSLSSQADFVGSFDQQLEDGLDLPLLMQEFDLRVLCSTDPISNRFQAHLDGDQEVAVARSTVSAVHELIETKADHAVDGLVALLGSQRRVGDPAHAVVRQLLRATARVLRKQARLASRRGRPATRRPRISKCRSADLAIWSAFLLGWEAELASSGKGASTPNLLLTWMHQLAQDFVRESASDRPLSGRWRSIMASLAKFSSGDRDALVESRANLVQSLKEHLEGMGENDCPTWLPRLRSEVLHAVEVSAAETTMATMELTVPPAKLAEPLVPRTFDDIVGQASAVATLRSRVRKVKHQSPLILHGPNGVGKRTLARLYAKALLCDQPVDGSPCNLCTSCVAFDGGSVLGYVPPVDAADMNAKGLMRQVIDKAHSATLTDRQIILVDNADQCPPDVFDLLLKTLEKPPSSATFVFMASELGTVRLAGQSRCLPIAVRPWSDASARTFVEQRLAALPNSVDPRLVEVLVAAGRGLPGKLSELCELVETAESRDLDSTRATLELDWVKAMPFRLNEVLNSLEAGNDWPQQYAGSTQLRQFRTILAHLYIAKVAQSPHMAHRTEPAMVHRETEAVSNSLAPLISSSAALGLHWREVWSEVSGAALSSE